MALTGGADHSPVSPTAARPPAHFILATVGTDGDIHPYLNLGLTLRERGHRVTLATHQHFEERSLAGGLGFQSLVSNSETEELVSQASLWHPIKAPWTVARWGSRFLHRQYAALSGLENGPGSILVASPGVLAARILSEARGIPIVSVILQPWMIQSLSAPPTMMGGLSLSPRAPRLIGKAYYRMFDFLGARLVGPNLRKLRASVELGPVPRLFQWWLSPSRVLGLFPDWYGLPQPDWPAQIRLTGFPLNRHAPAWVVPPETLKFCADGPSPIVVTFGTGMRHGTELFLQGIQACQQLGRRCVVITPARHQLPRSLPPGVHHCASAPFRELFPLCAAVIHHGGVGTVAQSLASGIPQLVIPLAFDQLDNARRVGRLGCGVTLSRSRADPPAIARSLAHLLTTGFKVPCSTIAAKFQGSDALENACDWLEFPGANPR